MLRGAWADAPWSVSRCSVECKPILRGAWNGTLWSVLTTLLLCLLTSACSLTKHLPEGETLYRGIKSIDYDKQIVTESNQEEGVITALADAYTTVEGLLKGDGSLQPSKEELTAAVRDSLRHASEKDKAAYESAKEEVEAVLSYAPNGALMGSSFVTHPFPLKLLIYNRYAGSKHRFATRSKSVCATAYTRGPSITWTA